MNCEKWRCVPSSNQCKSVGTVLLRRKQHWSVHSVLVGSATPTFCILLISLFSKSRNFGPAQYSTKVTGHISPNVKVIRWFTTILPHKWPSHMNSNSGITMNLLRYASNLSQSWLLVSDHLPFARFLYFHISYDVQFASADFLFPCSVPQSPSLSVPIRRGVWIQWCAPVDLYT